MFAVDLDYGPDTFYGQERKSIARLIAPKLSRISPRDSVPSPLIPTGVAGIDVGVRAEVPTPLGKVAKTVRLRKRWSWLLA
jgi:hypothetical protein